jgi:CBS domain-containing protein
MEGTVEDLMAREVVSLDEGMTVGEAVERMAGAGVHAAPVLRGGRVVGVLRERDVLALLDAPLRRLLSSHRSLRDEAERVRSLPVARAMERSFERIGPEASAYDAVRLLHETGQEVLPVVSGGRLVGVVSRTTVMEHLAGQGGERRA